MRVPLALAGLALVTTGLSATESAHAAAPSTCQGLPATITADGGPVTGTPGDDVISTTGVVQIDALAGHDVICAEVGTIYAGLGNDSVLSTAIAASSMTVHLGQGDDAFTAAHGNNTVDPQPGDSLGRDRIFTGDASDTVFSGVPTEANLDEVDLGPTGADALSVVLPAGSDLQADGGGVPSGASWDSLYLTDPGSPAAAWSVDLDGSVRRSGDVVAGFSRFSAYGVYLGATAEVSVAGTGLGDNLTLGDGTYDVSLGRGNDKVTLSSHATEVSGRIRGGLDSDGLVAQFRQRRLLVDLKAGHVRADSISVSAEGFQNLYGGAPKVRVLGDKQSNGIQVVGCDVRVEGRGGRDYLSYLGVEDAPECAKVSTYFAGGRGPDRLSGSNRAERLVGGRGNDRLTGFAGKDVLLGGPDRDRADGGKGKDRCVAEVRVACES